MEERFEIIKNILDEHNLVVEDGILHMQPHDYNEHADFTSKALLQTFNHFMKVAIHLRVWIFDQSP